MGPDGTGLDQGDSWSLRPLNILVVEDDVMQRRLLKSQLELLGHRVLEASDGNQALRIYGENPVELVITDVFMPDRDGLEIIRELKSRCPKLSIIATSGGMIRGTFDPLPLAKLFGARVLSKPYSQEELESVLEHLQAGEI
jgi:CheY-like chemotaxis protein